MSEPSTPPAPTTYPARLEVDYVAEHDRVRTLFRVVLVIPIAIVYGVLTSGAARSASEQSGGIVSGLFVATSLMILFRQRYPRWWFDFALELTRFSARICAFFALLTDEYPSTVETQSVHLDIDYPDVERDLNRWLPLVKWLLAVPHYVVLFFLGIGAIVAVVIAWFAILFTGRLPRGLFDYVVGVGRWGLRVQAYAFVLVTDTYPPFALR
jgi:hypothetical protein